MKIDGYDICYVVGVISCAIGAYFFNPFYPFFVIGGGFIYVGIAGQGATPQ